MIYHPVMKGGTTRIPRPATKEDALLLFNDMAVCGAGFIDQDGKRVDPDAIIDTPAGLTIEGQEGQKLFRVVEDAING